MSGKTRIKSIGVVRARSSSESMTVQAEAPDASGPVAEQNALAGPADLSDPVQSALDLEDAARAYTEVVQVLEAITRSTQTRNDPAAVAAIGAMATHLESAWTRWDNAHRRLIGSERRTTVLT